MKYILIAAAIIISACTFPPPKAVIEVPIILVPVPQVVEVPKEKTVKPQPAKKEAPTTDHPDPCADITGHEKEDARAKLNCMLDNPR